MSGLESGSQSSERNGAGRRNSELTGGRAGRQQLAACEAYIGGPRRGPPHGLRTALSVGVGLECPRTMGGERTQVDSEPEIELWAARVVPLDAGRVVSNGGLNGHGGSGQLARRTRQA
ncbi:MAG: hypothetical protein KTR25_14565 [Myxococcales bacterium]|nr:hypothetical protein [Myxococcales bacterium]